MTAIPSSFATMCVLTFILCAPACNGKESPPGDTQSEADSRQDTDLPEDAGDVFETVTDGDAVTDDIEDGGTVVLWDTNKRYIEKSPFSDALADRENWTRVPHGVTEYTFEGDAMAENDHFFLFLFSNDEDSPSLAAKTHEGRAWANEIYKVHDTGYRNFGMGNMWVRIVQNTGSELIIQSAEKGMRFGDPPVPITTQYTITDRPWLDIRPVENVNQQGQHDKRRLAGFLFGDASNDVILDAEKHGEFEENVYPSAGCLGILIFHRYNNEENDFDFMWFMTYPPGAEENELTYAGIHYPDPYWEWDCKPCEPSIGATYVYLEEKVIIGVLHYENNWKREDVNQPISSGEPYTTSFAAPYGGVWRVAAVFSDEDWEITEPVSEIEVDAGEHFVFTSPRDGTLEYLVIYLVDSTDETPPDIYTPMDVFRETILNE